MRSLTGSRPYVHVDRASATDRAFLAVDQGRTPKNFGGLLIFQDADGFDLASAHRLLAERVSAVPRLRQRLINVPFGCGGPVWVDDDTFDLTEHLRVRSCPDPADDQAMLDAAYAVVEAPLPRDRPLWSAAFLTGLSSGRTALVIALHHALADGMGGLGILAGLTDPGATPADGGFPEPRPTTRQLARAARSEWIAAVREIPRRLRLLRGAPRS